MTNATAGSGVGLTLVDPADEMAAFDALPPAIRAALNASTVKWCCQALAAECALDLWMGQEANVLAQIHQAEAYEREQFNEDHLRAYGYELPHVAAGSIPPLRAAA